MAEHIHRFTQSLDVWTHPWYRHWARDDLDAYCEFVREETDLRLGIEADFLPGREDRLANLLDGRPWDYVVGSLHFLRDEAVDLHAYPDWESWDIWRSQRPREGLDAVLRDARRGGAQRPVRHPRPPRPREGLGGARAAPGGRPAPLLRARDGRDRRVRRGDRGVHRRAAQAGGGDLPGGGLPGALPGGGPARWRCRATPTCPSSSATSTSATVDWLREPRGQRAGGVRGAPPAPGAARMSVRSGHRLRLAPLRGGAQAGARRRGGAVGRRAWPATRTPTCSRTR